MRSRLDTHRVARWVRGLGRAKPHARYAALGYWAWFGLDKPNQWAAAEYAWQTSLLALERQWVPARERHIIVRRWASHQRGKVYDRVVRAHELRTQGVKLPSPDVNIKSMVVPGA